MISDFAVFLTIVVMVLLDFAVGVPSQKLKVPSKFQVIPEKYTRNVCFIFAKGKLCFSSKQYVSADEKLLK